MRIGCVIGTRPEVIKLAPVVIKLREQQWARPVLVATAQHRELLDDALDLFGLVPDIDLDLMQRDQTLNGLFARAIEGLDGVIATSRLDAVIAQGDTTSVLAAAIACFHRGVPFLHVEAGLRSFDLENPFPEELNRSFASRIALLHFAPTAQARANLMSEGVSADRITVTGNTVIDALHWTAARATDLSLSVRPDSRVLLVTMHRRENFGAPLRSACHAIRVIADEYPDVEVVWPVHPNPSVQGPVSRMIGDHPRVHLVAPLNYSQFVAMMKRAYLVLTDSGGVQEEAPALARPVLVLRRETERPEVIETGVGRLIGTEFDAIVGHTRDLLDNASSYRSMATGISPYGDGNASARIVEAIERHFASAQGIAADEPWPERSPRAREGRETHLTPWS